MDRSPMLDKDFRQKAIVEGLRQLNSLRSVPGKVCVGVLYDDIVPGNADPKKDFMWFNCKPETTVALILKTYASGVALPQNFDLRHNNVMLELNDSVSKMNPENHSVILVEAVVKSQIKSESSRAPLQARSANNAFIKPEADTETKPGSAPTSHMQHVLPYKLLLAETANRRQLIKDLDSFLRASESTTSKSTRTYLNKSQLGLWEWTILFTTVDFFHEKIAFSNSKKDRIGSPLDTKSTVSKNSMPKMHDGAHQELARRAILEQWLALAPATCQWYQERAILFIDSFSIEGGNVEEEFLRFRGENAGFYAFFASNRDKYLTRSASFGTDKAFLMMHSEWKEMSHRHIAYWVQKGRDLRYTPASTTENDQHIEKTEAATVPTRVTTSLDSSLPVDPVVEPPEQISLQTLFSDCSPELLEAGVEQGVNMLERLKEPLRRVAPNLEAAEWLKSIESLQKQATQPRTIVGVVGNTGAGKSSVINAMLDEERLVPTNCMRACTAVVTEISYNYEDIPYRAQIEFITEKEWEKELQILFSDLLDSNGKISPQAWTQDSEASVAYAKIKAVYPKFTNEMLQQTSVEKLLKHHPVRSVLGGTKQVADKNPTEFYKHLQFYVDSKEKTTKKEGESNKGKPARPSENLEYWPLIKVVRIYVKAAALSTGAVIVDLPGVHDSNVARARVAEGYMKQCTGLWIVAPITRAVDDKAAKSLLGETFKRQLKMDGGFDSVTFICSKTDDISISEAQESLGLEQEMSGLWVRSDQYDSEARKHKKRLDELKTTKSDYSAIVDDIDEQIEKWEGLKEDIEDGKTVYPPSDESGCKKRKGSGGSSESFFPKKKRRTPDSDCGSDLASDDEPVSNDEAQDVSETQNEPLTLEAVEEKLSQLKTTKKEGRRRRQEIEAEMKEVRTHIKEVNEAKAEIQAKMSHIAIAGRNEYSRGAIQQDFASGIRELDHELAEENDASNFNPEVDIRDYDKVAQSLPVFCVSSRAYQKLQGRFQKEPNVPGFQTIEETEVPQLQAHCKRLTEASRESNSRRFLNNLEQLLNSLRLMTSSGDLKVTDKQKIARAEIVERTHKKMDEGIVEHIRTVCEQMADEIESDILEACNQALPTAAKSAMETVHHWGAPVDRSNRAAGGYYWATYKALCRRDGVYANAQGPHNWNAELIEPILKAVAPGWEKIFSRRINTMLNNAGSEIAEFLKKIHDSISNQVTQATGPVGSLHTLSQQLRVYQQVVKEAFQVQTGEVAAQSRDINRMFEPVITEEMHPAYVTCAEERGTGSFMRMKAAMSSHVYQCRESMFEQSIEEVGSALLKLVDEVEEALLNKIDSTLLLIKRDYNSAMVGSQSSKEGFLSREKRAALQDVSKYIEELESSYKTMTQNKNLEVSSEDSAKQQTRDHSLDAKAEDQIPIKEEERVTDFSQIATSAGDGNQEQTDTVYTESHDVYIKNDFDADNELSAAQLDADLFNWDV